MKVAGLIVTYNRKDLLPKTVNALLNQTHKLDKLFIVNNNSNDGTEKILKELSENHKEIEVITLSENIGGSGGFNYGIHFIYDTQQFDWIWLMDDDAVPAKNALENLIIFYNSQSFKKQNKIGVLQNKMIPDEQNFETLVKSKISLKKIYRHFGMFVGYFIKTEVVGKIGFPDKDFFIYYDDAEYTFRAKKLGYKTYTIDGSYIYHKDWAKLNRIKKGIFSKPDIPPWKGYYIYRNGFLMFKNDSFMRFLLNLYFNIDILIWKTVKPEVVPFAKKGMKDGLNFISGKKIMPGQKNL